MFKLSSLSRVVRRLPIIAVIAVVSGCPSMSHPPIPASLIVLPEIACPGSTVEVMWGGDRSVSYQLRDASGTVIATDGAGLRHFTAEYARGLTLVSTRSGSPDLTEHARLQIVGGSQPIDIGGVTACGYLSDLGVTGIVAHYSFPGTGMTVRSINRVYGDHRSQPIRAGRDGVFWANLPVGQFETTLPGGYGAYGNWTVESPLQDDETCPSDHMDPTTGHEPPQTYYVQAMVTCTP